MRGAGAALLLVLASAVLSPVCGQTIPTGEEVLRRVETTFASIDDYVVTLDITADIERLKVPPMNVTMYFKKPDRVHFTSRGFAMLPKESIGFTPSHLLERVEPERVTVATVDGKEQLEVLVKLKSDRSGLRRLILTIDPERWTVERVTTPQFDGRTVIAVFRHERIADRWLPVRLDVSFTAPQQDTTLQHLPVPPGSLTGTGQRTGTITVVYSGYEINRGLDDSVFEKKDEQ